jgi:hypothetical protein
MKDIQLMLVLIKEKKMTCYCKIKYHQVNDGYYDKLMVKSR